MSKVHYQYHRPSGTSDLVVFNLTSDEVEGPGGFLRNCDYFYRDLPAKQSVHQEACALRASLHQSFLASGYAAADLPHIGSLHYAWEHVVSAFFWTLDLAIEAGMWPTPPARIEASLVENMVVLKSNVTRIDHLMAMVHDSGGGFARAIVVAWRVADSRNRAALWAKFGDVFLRPAEGPGTYGLSPKEEEEWRWGSGDTSAQEQQP